jgi:hypothetical protein
LRYRDGLERPELARLIGYQPSSMSKVITRCLAAMIRQMSAGGLAQQKEREA